MAVVLTNTPIFPYAMIIFAKHDARLCLRSWLLGWQHIPPFFGVPGEGNDCGGNDEETKIDPSGSPATAGQHEV
jgi:hypothetical protein